MSITQAGTICSIARPDQGVRVMLSGGAGNNTISHTGEDRLGSMLREGRWMDLAKQWRLARSHGRSYKSLLRLTLAPLLPATAWDMVLRLRGADSLNMLTYGMLHPDVARRLNWKRDQGGASIHATAHRLTRREGLARFSRSDRDVFLGGTLAAWEIELRDPTNDKRILELCYSMPDEQFFGEGQARYLYRRMMKGVLPNAILEEKNRGRQAPDWREAAASTMPEIEIQIDGLAQCPLTAGILDIQKIRETVLAWNSNPPSLHPQRQNAMLIAIAIGRFAQRLSHE